MTISSGPDSTGCSALYDIGPQAEGCYRAVAASEADAREWDAFVARRPGASVYHRYAWRGFLGSACGCETHYLIARDGAGRVAGVLPLARLRSALFGDFLVSMPYFNYGGPVSENSVAERVLLGRAIDLARDLRTDHMELRETSPRTAEWSVRTDKVAMILALDSTCDAQFASFPAKLRSQVRRPEREGATVERGGADLLPKFYGVFSRNMRDLGTPVYGRSFFRGVLDLLGPNAEIIVVSVNGQAAAAGLLVHSPGRTEIPWASSLREYNRFGVNMLMYWEALKSAIVRGSQIFDFGRSTVDAGTYRFKAQWGAKPQPLYWHYWLPMGQPLPELRPTSPKFALAVSAWQRMPIWAANLLGPFIVRRLP